MGDQFISGVNLDDVLDNVLKGNEYNDNPHVSVTMIKMDLFGICITTSHNMVMIFHP